MAALITAPRLMAVGGGALAELPGMMGRLGLARPLIVTDPYIAGCGILDRATALLDERAHPVGRVHRTRCPTRPPTRSTTGVARMREGDYDSLVAIGGGSSIDTAKGMSVLYANGGRMRDYKVPNEIPLAGPAGRRDPDHRRHRLRGDALYGHHRYRDRREDADRRARLLSGGGDRRLRADPDDAAAADRRYRHRQPDARDRGLCQPRAPTRSPTGWRKTRWG